MANSSIMWSGFLIVVLLFTCSSSRPGPRKNPRGKPPKFKISPKKRVMSLKTGQTAKLKCHSTGDPNPDIQWFKDGQPYGQHKRMSVSPSGWTLNLRYLTVQDSGTYLCRVGNSLGTINRTFTVMVKGRKSEFKKSSNGHITAQVGESVRMRCELVNPTGVNVTWFRDGKVIEKNLKGRFRVKIGKTSLLRIKDIKEEDAGDYECSAKNNFGSVSREFNLTVKGGKPKIKKSSKLTYVRAQVGGLVRMRCKLVNPTGVTVKWFKDGKVIEKNSNRRFRVKSGKVNLLRIEHIKKGDAGEYECRAENNLGAVSRVFHLKAKGTKKQRGKHGEGPPWLTRALKTPEQFLVWPASSDAKLKCEADGAPPLTYRWLKDGKPFTYRRLDPKINTSRWFLKFKTAVPSDSGVYTCIVSNRYGNVSHRFRFDVMEKARSRPILSELYPRNHSVKSGSNVTFECRELRTTLLTEYRWLKWNELPKNYPKLDLNNFPKISTDYRYKLINPVQYRSFKVEEEYGGKVILTNVTKEDEGLYTCLVSNHIGRSWRSAFLKIDDTGLD